MKVSKKVLERAGMLLSGNDEEIIIMIKAIANHKKQNDLIDYIDEVVPTYSNENSFMCADFLELIGYGEKDKETRVYVINTIDERVEDIDNLNGLTNEEFMFEAEEQGRVYTLEGFQRAFNESEVNTEIDVIRFIEVAI